jgi:spore maturation protein CgeB
VPFGYTRAIDYPKCINYDTIDTLFMGLVYGRRIKFIERMKKVTIGSNLWLREKDEDRIADKMTVLTNTRIGLHINSHDPEKSPIQSIRILAMMANNILVISEYCSQDRETSDYSEYIDFCRTPEEMQQKVDYWLNHEEERLERVSRAYNWIRTNKHMRHNIPWKTLEDLE